MEYKIISSVYQKVSIAVLLIDDFTDNIIIGSSGYVTIEGEKKPIVKEDGYYIFLNLKKKKYNIKAGGTIYCEEIKEVDLSVQNSLLLIKIRLFPNKYYPDIYHNGNNITYLQGRAEPDSRIQILCDTSDDKYKLMCDYTKDNNNQIIKINYSGNKDLEGKLLYIKNKERTEKELIFIDKIHNKENKEYLISNNLLNNYSKIGTKLGVVGVTIANHKGEFFVPIVNMQTTNDCLCKAIGENTVEKKFDIIADTTNIIDLTL